MKLRPLLFVTALAALALSVPAGAWAQPMSGICEFTKNYRASQKKTCLLDHYNSGLIQLITNNGTLNFELHDSRLYQYNLNGEIWYFRGDIFDGGTFVLVKDPSRGIVWTRIM